MYHLLYLTLSFILFEFVECVPAWEDTNIDRILPMELFFVASALFMAAFISLVTRLAKIPFPYTVFILTIGILFGIGKSYNYAIRNFTTIMFLGSENVCVYFLPPLVFKTSFCIDAHTFLRSWVQILLVFMVGVIMTMFVVGFTIGFVLDPTWTTYKPVLFGLLCAPTYPVVIVKILRDIGYQTKHITSLLEGESMAGLSLVYIIYKSILAFLGNNSPSVITILVFWTTIGGILSGLIFGKLVGFLISRSHHNPGAILLWTLVMPYAAYIVCECFLEVSGVICVVAIGIFVSIERLGLPAEIDALLSTFWDLVHTAVNAVLLLMIGIFLAQTTLLGLKATSLVVVLVTYTFVMLSRFTGLVLISPLLSRTGYGLNYSELVVLVWGGLRGIFGPVLACSLDRGVVGPFFETIFVQLAGIMLLTLFINAVTMKLLLKYFGVTSLSLARQSNMNNCMKHIMSKREGAIVALKMDRFLSDANWPLIYTTTLMNHPYKNKMSLEEFDDKEKIGFGIHTTICPECHTAVPSEPTAKEMREMTREARLRILKAMKISYIKQFDNGLLSKEGIRTLSNLIDIALDAEDALIDMEGLFKLFRRKGLMGRVRNRVWKLINNADKTKIYPPRKKYRRFCYYIVTHNGFDIFMSVVILLNMVPIFMELIMMPPSGSVQFYVLAGTNTLFFVIYLLEFILKIYGYAWIYLCSHGFHTYFQSLWNIFDFVVLLVALIDLCLDYMDIFIASFVKAHSGVATITLIAKATRLVRFFRLFKLCQAWYPNILAYSESKLDSYRAFAYEVGKGFVYASEEILETLPQTIQHEGTRSEIKVIMEANKLAIMRELGLIQKERPWIAITVKSKQAMRAILNNMKDSVIELKVAGWLDDYEYNKLQDAVHDSMKLVKHIESIPPNSPEVIFQEVPWMGSDISATDYLYRSVNNRILDTGSYLCRDGQDSPGIYIVITGLLKLRYTPKTQVLDEMAQEGKLPILDCIMNKNFSDKIEDYLVSGNTVGELSTLTGRSYNCDIIAETPTEVYFLPKEIVMETIQHDVDDVLGLESRIWKSVTLRLVLAILMDVPTYQSQGQVHIKLALERCFVPKLTNYTIFAVSDMIEDIILLEGMVVDGNTDEVYTAPCYISRTVQRIVLPRSSQYKLNTNLEPKLLIIPVKDQDEYDLMLNEEHISEMVIDDIAIPFKSPHSIQSQASKVKKKRKPVNVFQRKTKQRQSFSSKSSQYARSSQYAARSSVMMRRESVKDIEEDWKKEEEETELQNYSIMSSIYDRDDEDEPRSLRSLTMSMASTYSQDQRDTQRRRALGMAFSPLKPDEFSESDKSEDPE